MRRPLVRGRGLKRLGSRGHDYIGGRPLVRGRGLKRCQSVSNSFSMMSPPRAGAWIETSLMGENSLRKRRRPLVRGRGLKLVGILHEDKKGKGRPLVRGRGLKRLATAYT